MNPRIRDLAEQALKTPPEEVSYDKFVYVMSEDELEKFSELIIADCVKIFAVEGQQYKLVTIPLPPMWPHYCPIERSDMEIGVGEACSWCGTTILQLE
jgi:hypothetical protein